MCVCEHVCMYVCMYGRECVYDPPAKHPKIKFWKGNALQKLSFKVDVGQLYYFACRGPFSAVFGVP